MSSILARAPWSEHALTKYAVAAPFIVASLLLSHPGSGIAAEGNLSISLAKIEPRARDCRAYFVVTNRNNITYRRLKLDVVVFQPDGVIGQRFAVDLGPLRAKRRVVKLFDIANTSCAQVGSFLINDVMACRTRTKSCLNHASVRRLEGAVIGSQAQSQSQHPPQNGYGTYSWPDGSKYVGEFRDGRPNGQGTSTWPDGSKYIGEVRNGKFHGQGTYTFPDGGKYVGLFRYGEPTGGTRSYPDGSRYIGAIVDGKFHGEGTFISSDGSKYVGEFRENKEHGQGTLMFPDGSKYVGAFRDSKIHGHGTYTFADGGKYVGAFRDNKANGQGAWTYSDGSKYVGEFGDSQPNGQGTHTWPDGEKYVGEFQNGKYHGQGIVYSADGSVMASGRWSNGTLVARADTPPQPGRPPSTSEEPKIATGSGFIVSNDGFVLTNHHVVEKCHSVTVQGQGSATIRGLDKKADLALLKFEGKTSAISFRESAADLGDPIYALGFPLAGVLASSVHFTGGMISSLSGVGNDTSQFEFTAPIQPGNSGGPLVDAEGNVVGVVTSRLSDLASLEHTGAVPQLVAFAVRSEIAEAFLRANGVEPVMAEETDKSWLPGGTRTLSSSEIADNAKKHVVQVVCHRGDGQASSLEPEPNSQRGVSPESPTGGSDDEGDGQICTTFRQCDDRGDCRMTRSCSSKTKVH